MPAGHVVHTRQAVGTTVANDLALCIGGSTLIDVFADAGGVPSGVAVFDDIAGDLAIAFIGHISFDSVGAHVGVAIITNDCCFAEVNAVAWAWQDVAIDYAVGIGWARHGSAARLIIEILRIPLAHGFITRVTTAIPAGYFICIVNAVTMITARGTIGAFINIFASSLSA